MRVAVLATGGKDSTLALYRVLSKGYEVKCLVSMLPLREDSWMFHYPNMHLMDLFSEAVGIPLVKCETSGMKEVEVEDLKSLIAKLDIDGLVSGAIASNYQRARIEAICKQLGLECITPLWQEKPPKILKEILDLKFEVIITGVFAYGFSKDWLGRKIDQETVKALADLNERFGVSLVGEGGEYETLVLDAPFFKKRLKILETEKVWRNQSGYFIVKKAELEEKAR
ncbi:MAG: TIGR00289 family protein [Candidatus Bathyarchaeota archaeon]|jgi:predicted ATP pyrophosphatase (TIGR00289 family)|nr:TIGR00289 family protein [Candidatus Bathyarchaeota archaeon A05DMB-3]MDH7607454.1 TIGR00289 family protein [Candidatus Bathyarchaeota archaeon]